MADFSTVFVTGKIYWCKALGKPVMNYDGDAKEWTFDFVPDDVDFLKEHRLLDRLKEDKKGTIPGDFLHLKKPELNSEGEKNDPIRFYDDENKAWDRSVAIGNGSSADLKLTIADWGKGKKKSIWVAAVRITDHVAYEADEFAGMGSSPKSESKPKAKTAKPKTKASAEDLEDLDDDIPFD